MLSSCGETTSGPNEREVAAKVDAGLSDAVVAGETLVTVDLLETPDDMRRWPEATTRHHQLKQRVSESLRGLSFAVDREFRHLPLFAARVQGRRALSALASLGPVAHVHAIRELELAAAPASSFEFIRQDRAVAAIGATFQGEGTYVAVLDSGIDFAGLRTPSDSLATAELPAARAESFGICVAGAPDVDGGQSLTGRDCRVDYVRDFAPTDGAADDVGHGTNVAGVVAMVAPETRLIGLDVLRQTTRGPSVSSADVNAAIDWVVEQRTRYNADAHDGRNIVAMNMSFGSGKSAGPCDDGDPLTLAIRTARAAGVLSAVSSGNSGFIRFLASPACVSDAVSVGAVLWKDARAGTVYPGAGRCTDGTAGPDTPSCFSNTAPFLTLLAPGVSITAAGITDQGTSQAAPHVAGAIAALAGSLAEPRETAGWPADNAAAVVRRLTHGAPLVHDRRNKLSFPRLDLLSAAADASTSGVTWTNKVGQTVTAPVSLVARGYGPTFMSQAVGTAPGAGGFASATWNDVVPASGTVALALTAGIPVPAKTASGTLIPLLGGLRAADGETVHARGAVLGVDVTAPVPGRVTATATGTSREMTVAWSDSRDVHSGIAGYRVFAGLTKAPKCLDSTTPPAVAVGPDVSRRTFSQLAAPDGTNQTFYVCAIDVAGNPSAMASAGGATKPEAHGPTGTATIGSGSAILKTRTATLEIVASDESDTDEDSAVDFFCVGLASAASCSNWVALTNRTNPTAVSPFTRTATFTDGPVAVWLKDKWGNVSRLDPHDSLSPTDAVVDTTAPVDGGLIAVRQKPSEPSTVRFTLTGWADVTSGIVRLLVASDAPRAPANCAAGVAKDLTGGTYRSLGTTFTETLAVGTARSYRICAVDAYGNVSRGRTVTIH